MKKVLWYSDSPVCSTGFGTVARNLLSRLAATGQYDITVIGINHWVPRYNPEAFPYDIYAAGINPQRDQFGTSMLSNFIENGDWDIFFSLADIEVVANCIKAVRAARKAGKRFRWIQYTPIDVHVVMPELARLLLEVDAPVTYTKFAWDVLTEACPELAGRLRYIYHGCDTETFQPLHPWWRRFKRQEYFDLDDSTFMVMNVNRNQWRKDMARTMAGFKPFKERHPKAKLYLHAKLEDEGGNLAFQAECLGLDLKEDLIFTPPDFTTTQGYDFKTLNEIYNCADAVVSTTLGEGWGLATTEAFCCKVPVLMPRNTSMPEIVGAREERGFLSKCGPEWMIAYGHDEVPRPVTNIRSFASGLERILEGGPAVTEKVEAAYAWAQEHTWDKIFEEWLPIFEGR